MSDLREECGVFGVFAPDRAHVASLTYYGLYALQHRGQESCGIVVNDDGVFRSYKDDGLVNDVFTPARLTELGEGCMAVGHVRYGANTTGDRLNAQPIVVNHIKGRMAIANNGSLCNFRALRDELELDGGIFHTTSDAEIISYLITKERLNANSIEESINKAMTRLVGSYSIVVMSPQKLIAFRDPYGFHPLCYGKREDGIYVIASESCALDAVGATLIREIDPGEILIFDKNGMRSIRDHCGEKPHRLCVFEHIYFARPDSVIEGCSVHEARLRAGMYLAKAFPVEADVVIGVPDSGLDAAIGYAKQSGIPYEVGFIKNKYIGRTFIAPGQSARENLVRIKLNPISSVVKGKRVVMVDDSIVRGTTCQRIVGLLRQAGALEVHMRSSAPPFVDICYYGTDISSRDILIANRHTNDEIARILNVDSLGYLPLADVVRLTDNPENGFCCACFTGEHPTEHPDEIIRSRYDTKISEAKPQWTKRVQENNNDNED